MAKKSYRDILWWCHQEGRNAYRAMMSLKDCPYQGDRAKEWQQGWNEMKDEDDVDS